MAAFRRDHFNKVGSLAKINEEQTNYLIELYQNHPAIWDSRSEAYRNISLKRASWTSIRLNFQQRYGIACTDDNMQRKLANLRSMYTRELRLQQASRRKERGGVRVPQWPFFLALQFLHPVVSATLTSLTSSTPCEASKGRQAGSEASEQKKAGEEVVMDDSEEAGTLLGREVVEKGLDEAARLDASLRTDVRPTDSDSANRASAPPTDSLTPFQKCVLDCFNVKKNHCNGRSAVKREDELGDWARGLVDVVRNVTTPKNKRKLKLEISEFAIKRVKEYMMEEEPD